MTSTIENIARSVHQNTTEWKFHKKTLVVEILFCFASFMIQNLPPRGRKTEKNKEMA
jgi:hypothetical protein